MKFGLTESNSQTFTLRFIILENQEDNIYPHDEYCPIKAEINQEDEKGGIGLKCDFPVICAKMGCQLFMRKLVIKREEK